MGCNRVWTSKEEQYLRDNFVMGMSTKEFAKKHAKKLNKTTNQIVNKIGEMGLNKSYFTSELYKELDAENYINRVEQMKNNIKIGSKVRVQEKIDISTLKIDRMRAANVAEIYKHHVLVDFGKYKSSYRWDELEAIL